jgi:hypothetical protein
MILSTHAIVGGSVASLFPTHPFAAIVAGFASHFVIDAIPHWDCPLRSISLGPRARNRLTLRGPRLRDLALIAFDGCAGLALAVGLFATPATTLIIALGALAAILPDPLQFVYTLYPGEPLKSLQRFHGWMHMKHQIGARIGASSQVAFVAAVVGIKAVLH